MIRKSIWAVLAGFLLLVALSVSADLFLRTCFPDFFGHSGANLTAIPALVIIGYGAVFAALSGYLTARLARTRPMMHATVLGAIWLLFALFGVIGSRAPLWFNVGFLAVILPSVWAGALVRTRKISA